MSLTSTSTATAAPSSSTSSLSQTASSGPITNLPLELVTHTLNCLLDSSTSSLERQAESQRFLRVNRLFYSGYLLSDGACEYTVSSSAAALLLSARLGDPDCALTTVRRLWVGLSSRSESDSVVASLVGRCSSDLTEFVWDPLTPNGVASDQLATDVVDAWAECHELRKYELSQEARTVSDDQLERLLASWPKITNLDIYNFDILYSKSPQVTDHTARWTVPTRLYSLSIYIDTPETVTIFAKLIKASAPTLNHISFQCSKISIEGISSAFAPVAHSLRRLEYRRNENTELDTTCLPTVLAAIPDVPHLKLPFEVVHERDVAEELRKRKPLALLALEPIGGERVSDVIAVLAVVKAHALEMPRSWWEAQQVIAREVEPDRLDGGGERTAQQLLDEWWRSIERAVPTLSLV